MGDGIAATSVARLTGGDTAARPREASTGGLQGKIDDMKSSLGVNPQRPTILDREPNRCIPWCTQ